MAASSQYKRRPVANSRRWPLRSYVTRFAGLLVAMGVATVGLSSVKEQLRLEVAYANPTYSPEWFREQMMWYSKSVGVDLLAPIHEQFLDVVATRVLHPIFLGPLLLAGLVAVYFTWQHRSKRHTA